MDLRLLRRGKRSIRTYNREQLIGESSSLVLRKVNKYRIKTSRELRF